MRRTLHFKVETNEAGDRCALECPWLDRGYCTLFSAFPGRIETADAVTGPFRRLSGCAAHEAG